MLPQINNLNAYFLVPAQLIALLVLLWVCVYSVLARLIFKYSRSQKGIHLSDKKVMAPPVILLVIHSTYTSIPIHPPDIFLWIPYLFFSFSVR